MTEEEYVDFRDRIVTIGWTQDEMTDMLEGYVKKGFAAKTATASAKRRGRAYWELREFLNRLTKNVDLETYDQFAMVPKGFITEAETLLSNCTILAAYDDLKELPECAR